MQLPSIEVTAHGYGLAVGWQDETRRYHIWLDAAGKPRDDVIHSNLLVKPADKRVDGHRALKQSAKKWAPLVAAIVSKVNSDELIVRARERAAAEQAAAEAKRAREIREADLKRLERAIDRLPGGVAMLVRDLPDDVKIAFVTAIDND